ncbi:glutamate--cysteine ligase [Corynebacterium halotolerans]|uniref:glutamate--cysteine ligase n=1 Tax=Corynebacterium halotolerans TaxID=225326 RepID=UPI003CF36D3D
MTKRTFGVEEELLLVDAVTLAPLPAAERLVALQQEDSDTDHEITLEFKQEQIEVVSPPQTTLLGQLECIRAGRKLADAAASRVGGRVVALSTVPGEVDTHLIPKPRFHNIHRRFGITAVEQLTCGFHVHVLIKSQEEGVAALDRIRDWLPVLLALSANSPFWQGVDTGFSSYRYQVWNRWPLTGPTDFFGSAAAHDHHQRMLLATKVPLDKGMIYFDARLCEHQPTLEIRVADVCLDSTHAAVLATIARALVETAIRHWEAGVPVVPTPTSALQAWSWQASSRGVDNELVNPMTGAPAPAVEVVAGLMEVIRPVLVEYGEETMVAEVVSEMLSEGPGARWQREVFASRREVRDVVEFALGVTHRDGAAKYAEG